MGHDFDVVTDEDLHAEGLARSTRTASCSRQPSRSTSRADARRAVRVRRAGRPADVSRRQRLLLAGRRRIARASAPSRSARRSRHPRLGGGAGRVLPRLRRRATAASGGATAGPRSCSSASGSASQAPFEGNWYRRAPGAADPRAAWILDGVGGDDRSATSGSRAGARRATSSTAPTRGWARRRTRIVLASSEGQISTSFYAGAGGPAHDVTTWTGEPGQA